MTSTSALHFAQKTVRHLNWRFAQAANVPFVLFRRFGSQLWNDHWLARRTKITVGSQALGDRVVIYVIYSPNGILASHLAALKEIERAGYSAFIIANSRVPDADRVILSDRCACLLERANFGYDFGAYRDGIRMLQHRFPQISRLALANDSVWFAFPGKPNWFVQAEGVDADFVGASSNLAVIPLQSDHWSDQTWDYDTASRDYHLCSFLLSFRPNVFNSRIFCQFWARLPMSNNKHWVVSNGEVALSRVLREAGFTSGTTSPLRDLPAWVARLSGPRLKELLERLIIPEDPKLRLMRDQVLKDCPLANRKRSEAFIFHAVAATGPAYALADLALREMDQSFLKKTPLRNEASGAAASLAILADIDAKEVLVEALELTKKNNNFGSPR